jgi:multidrug transporter EmrE-like cation transporter
MKPITFSLLFCGVGLNAAGQLLLKAGVSKLGPAGLRLGPSLLALIARVGKQPRILSGLGCYVLSTLLWILVLSRMDVMVAYPMVSIGYVLNAFLAWEFLGESLTMARLVGIAVIAAGALILIRT